MDTITQVITVIGFILVVVLLIRIETIQAKNGRNLNRLVHWAEESGKQLKAVRQNTSSVAKHFNQHHRDYLEAIEEHERQKRSSQTKE